MRLKPQADSGGYWGLPLFSLGGHDNPLAVDLKNATFGQIVLQQGSLSGRATTICNRQDGPPPVYLPCDELNGIGSDRDQNSGNGDAGKDVEWGVGPYGGPGTLPAPLTLDQFTIEGFIAFTPGGGNAFFTLSLTYTDGYPQLLIQFVQSPTPQAGLSAYDQDGGHDGTGSALPALSGKTHFAFQRTATGLQTFIAGNLLNSVPRAGHPLQYDDATKIGLLLAFSTDAGTTKAVVLGGLAISSTARYTLGNFTPPKQMPDDGDAIYSWPINEHDGPTITDSQLGAEITVLPGYVPLWLPLI